MRGEFRIGDWLIQPELLSPAGLAVAVGGNRMVFSLAETTGAIWLLETPGSRF